jgi:phosphoribosylformimino-5-aminoimidazole carboxamide ribotide isomerase
MLFRPCIDLHQGKVKQIVGGTLDNDGQHHLTTNFESEKPAQWYARQYSEDKLTGGHVIRLGSGNTEAARAALAAWPNGLQIGGGITLDNASEWLDAGASAVILTSWVFHHGTVDETRLKQLADRIGSRCLVLDLSCRRRDNDYYIVTNRWQTFTREKISFRLLDHLARYCAEFLIHAVDVEGRCQGIEGPLVSLLGQWSGIPVTYAGGIHSYEDLDIIENSGQGRLDFTVGSALDIFGGHGLVYKDLVQRYGPNAVS